MIALPGSKIQKPYHPPMRSLIMSYGEYSLDWNPFHVISKLRLLKVLDLSSLELEWSATLQPLIHLKYLALSTTEFAFHPESHPHLETLIVKSDDGVVLPPNFWEMKTLRHVEIVYCYLEHKQRMFEESLTMGNLRTLRSVVCRIDEVDVLARRCPNLQDLWISIYRNKDSAEVCIKLGSLTQLQTLHLYAYDNIASNIHFPSNLKKLVLKGRHVVTAASSIAGLPSLDYLKLEERSDDQPEEWCLGDIKFHKLKILKLGSLRISRWEASEESFPLLETLVIRLCYKLEEIPLSFADIQTLKQIKLNWRWKESLLASAVKIKEQVQEIEGSNRIDLITRMH